MCVNWGRSAKEYWAPLWLDFKNVLDISVSTVRTGLIFLKKLPSLMIKIFTETLFQTVSQYSALRLNKSQLMHRYFN